MMALFGVTVVSLGTEFSRQALAVETFPPSTPLGSSTSGDRETHSLRLEWRVPGTCSSAASFKARVAELTSRVTWSDDSGAVVVVSMSGDGLPAIAQLFHRESAGWNRSIVGAWDCPTLARALAFALAVEMDPSVSDAQPTPVPNRGDMTDEPDLAPAIEPPISGNLRGPLMASDPPPTEAGSLMATSPGARRAPGGNLRRAVAPAPVTGAEPLATRRRVWTGVGPSLVVGIGDEPAYGAAGSFTARVDDQSPGAWQWFPHLGVGASYTRMVDRDGRVAASGELWTGDIRLSPLGWVSHAVGAFTEMGLAIGTLSVDAQNVALATSRRALWAAVEAGVGSQVSVGPTMVELVVGVQWHLSQPHFLVLRTPDDDAPRRLIEVPALAPVVRFRLSVPLSRSSAAPADIQQSE